MDVHKKDWRIQNDHVHHSKWTLTVNMVFDPLQNETPQFREVNDLYSIELQLTKQ